MYFLSVLNNFIYACIFLVFNDFSCLYKIYDISLHGFFFVMPKEQDIFVGQLVLCLYWHVILIGA
jgi:hypothetical protein